MAGNFFLKSGLALLAATGMASAHLSTANFKPTAGQVVTIGATFAITWTVATQHGAGTDIALSVNGGETWTDIKTDFKDNDGLNTFNWTVAGSATTTAKIRICQHDAGGSPCTDADKVSDLSSGTGGHYILVGNAFTLAASTGLRPAAAAAGSMSIGFPLDASNVDVSFALARNESVSLRVFDTQGRLAATLLEGTYGPGSHKLAVFSNRLGALTGSLIFKLQAGDQVRTGIRNASGR